jgi:hypothetical protein
LTDVSTQTWISVMKSSFSLFQKKTILRIIGRIDCLISLLLTEICEPCICSLVTLIWMESLKLHRRTRIRERLCVWCVVLVLWIHVVANDDKSTRSPCARLLFRFVSFR